MDLLARLEEAPVLLARVAAELPEPLIRTRAGPFAFVEHVWHLADLEQEGFGARISRMLSESEPWLPDFDGERVARERNYLALELARGLSAFAAARAANLLALRAVLPDQWQRGGTQEAVGRITVAEMPQRMLDHDRAHFHELADLLAQIMRAHSSLADLRAAARGGPASSSRAA